MYLASGPSDSAHPPTRPVVIVRGDVLTITAVPESITRERLCQWLNLIGLDANEVRSLRADRDGIIAEVYAKHTDGNNYTIDGQAARHIVSIPVTD